MKKILVAVFSLITVFAKAQMAPTAEDVVDNYAKAMGGLDNFLKVNSAKMTGVITVQGMDLPLTMQIINGKAIRVDVEAMGQKVVNVYYEGKGWKIDPFNGSGEPTDVDGVELAGYKIQTSLTNSLMNFRNLGNKVEMAGEETLEGTKCYKIKLILKDDGASSNYFISSKDYSLVKSVSSREVQGQQMEIETLYSDLKEFGGLKFYMTRTQQAEGQVFQTISLTNVELNAAIDPKIFNK